MASARGSPSSGVDGAKATEGPRDASSALPPVPLDSLKISIPSVTLIANEFAVYKIWVSHGDKQTTIFRRYSSCKRLHTELSRISPTLLGVLRFPKKKWFGNKTAHFMEKRRAQLEMYFQMLLSTELPRPQQLSDAISSFFSTSDEMFESNRFLNAVCRTGTSSIQ